MRIPHSELSEATLRGILEEFITREGTDYGMEEYSLAQKLEQLQRQLESGEVEIHFDPESESCNILSREDR